MNLMVENLFRFFARLVIRAMLIIMYLVLVGWILSIASTTLLYILWFAPSVLTVVWGFLAVMGGYKDFDEFAYTIFFAILLIFYPFALPCSVFFIKFPEHITRDEYESRRYG